MQQFLQYFLLLLPVALRPFQFGLGFLYNWCPFLFSNAFVLHHFTPSSLKSSSTSFIHLSQGHPLPLRPSNFPSKIFFTDLVSFILTTCPSHSSLRIFITFTISGALYLVINSSFVLILHCPFSFVGPYIFLNSPIFYLTFIYSLTCFGRPHAHHQELNNCSSILWFYRWSVAVAVLLVVVGTLSCK